MYINTSFKYHRVTCTQSCFLRKVHDLLGQPRIPEGLEDEKIYTISMHMKYVKSLSLPHTYFAFPKTCFL